MKRPIFFILFFLFIHVAFTQIIHIPLDQPTIQAGINVADHGDTVLVQPGIYIENINFNGKNITVASLYLFNQDTSYISQTIIDGNQDGRVVTFENGEDSSAVLNGFTVRNGYIVGAGGGIYCYSSTPSIKNSIIKNNSAESNPQGEGGGICCSTWSDSTYTISLENLTIVNNAAGGKFGGNGGGLFCHNMSMNLINVKILNNSTSYLAANWCIGGGASFSVNDDYLMTIYMAGSTIAGNITHGYGGGIYLGDHNEYSQFFNLVFDSTNRCNIYSNKGAVGADLFSRGFHEVVLDTFSVLNPTDFHAEPLYNYSFDIQNAKLQQVESDLFVSPDGDNSNSGQSPDDPLQSINYALSIILVDSLHPRTLNLQEGIYSASNNHDFFPINIPDYLKFIGASDRMVFIDAEDAERVMTIIDNKSNLISGVCIQNGYGDPEGGGIYCNNSNPEIQNVTVTNNTVNGPGSGGRGGGLYFESSSPSLRDMIISDNTAYWGRGGGIYYVGGSNLTLNNVIIKNNNADVEGGGIHHQGLNSDFKNVLITENSSGIWGGGMYFSAANSTFQNLTIADNISQEYGGGIYYSGGNNSIINSIIYGNIPNQIQFMEDTPYPEYPDTLFISYSNIQDGLDSIGTLINDTVYWLEGNIDMDPQFLGAGNTYELWPNSPCIDAGTPDTTGLNLPPHDILGNIRIWDGNGNGTAIIDMGAYEFGAPIFVGNEDYDVMDDGIELTNYPNPFSGTTTIIYRLTEPGTVELELYDNLGRKVENLINQHSGKGEYRVTWNAEGVSPGIYFYRLQAGDQVATGKMVLMR